MNDYFEQNKKLILQLANTEAGRFLLGLKDKDRIIKVSPNSVHQLKDFQNGEAVIQAKFWACDNVAQIFLPILTKIEIAQDYQPIKDKYEAFLHFSELERNRKYPQIYLDDFYTTSEDGTIQRGWVSTWSDARDGAGQNINKTGTTMNARAAFLSGVGYEVYRSFCVTNTSPLPDAAIIISAVWNLSMTQGAGNGNLVCCQGTQGDTLELADYQAFVRTDFGRLTNPGAGWQTLSLNSSGINNINKTGNSYWCFQHHLDFDNVAPTDQPILIIETSEATNKPYLTVTYQKGGAFLHNFL
jgi:hypothetical protein